MSAKARKKARRAGQKKGARRERGRTPLPLVRQIRDHAHHDTEPRRRTREHG